VKARLAAGIAGGVAAGLVLLAGCSSAPATQAPGSRCRIGDFLGDWVNARRPDEGVSVGRDAVTVIAGSARTRIAYVVRRDFGLVTRQVLRQEFANLAALGSLPAPRSGRDERVCALQLIRARGAAALVTDGNREIVFLEETRTEDPPATMRLRRGQPRLAPPADLLTPPT
jgi:hypothetical protein